MMDLGWGCVGRFDNRKIRQVFFGGKKNKYIYVKDEDLNYSSNSSD